MNLGKLIKPLFATAGELEIMLRVSTLDGPLVLCQFCYNTLYRQLHPLLPCASCGARPKGNKGYSHHSPNASVISKHLTDTTGIQVRLQDDKFICANCYKTHCSIIKSLEQQHNGSDDALNDSIAIWKHTCENRMDTVTKATVASVLYVAKHLLDKKAVLLPWTCRVFLEAYGLADVNSVNSVDLSLELGESSV